MDEPGLAWPSWKFGMKRDDLFTTLQDQYNTIPSSIQDPEAFHHDVYEISHEASSPDEFHRLMAERKEQRIRELNDSLESAALEIIANPSLIGTEQWQHAVQLFRTKSLDSLVRYFSSYLPLNHPWHRPDEPSLFDDGEKALTREPLSISTCVSSHLPPSPRSMTMYSDSSAASPIERDAHEDHPYLEHLSPVTSASFSESEPDHFHPADIYHLRDDEGFSQLAVQAGAETPDSSISDASETHQKEFLALADDDHNTADKESQQESVDETTPENMESDTPTPKPEFSALSFFEAKPSPLSSSIRHRSLSPSRLHPLSTHPIADCRRSRSPRKKRRDHSPVGRGRRVLGQVSSTRIQKSVPDAVPSRTRGRQRVDRDEAGRS
ncbi:uncharacterized protein E0L32_004025 [Thyridium curvatum]|uniref:Uncharacterized protein n=1 Tax=Thyridium curvatum TaxID=1093900 RepID=A0A507BAX4_9PEZI|nr:uncharacterized protein E0L32_004025 [Thyridium curvatum]TPX16376.1 hypothetical protein E0L32_004025 [Thyridium curvatum]